MLWRRAIYPLVLFPPRLHSCGIVATNPFLEFAFDNRLDEIVLELGQVVKVQHDCVDVSVLRAREWVWAQTMTKGICLEQVLRIILHQVDLVRFLVRLGERVLVLSLALRIFVV